MNFLDKIYITLTNDPIYLIMACIILLIISLVFAKDLFERVLDGVLDNTTNIKDDYPVRAKTFVDKTSKGLDIAISKVKKRKKLLELIKKLITSEFIKKYLIKVMKKYPNDIPEDKNLLQ